MKLRSLTDGELLPWFAPALRGLILKPLRDHFCAQMGGKLTQRESSGIAEWQRLQRLSTRATANLSNQNYCAGCLKNTSCTYGRIFEPDLQIIAPEVIQRGDDQGVRGISIATAMLFSAAEKTSPNLNRSKDASLDLAAQLINAKAGIDLSARLLAIGQRSIDLIPVVLEAVDAFGQSQGLGYQAPVKFAVDYSSIETCDWPVIPEALSINLDAGTLPEITIEFESPLLLKSCFHAGKLVVPNFHDLLTNSVRLLIRTVREYHDPSYLQTASFTDFLSVSRTIATSHHSLFAFEQPSISSRGLVNTDGKRPLRGWLGSMTFANVPVSFLPWLQAAGRLGVGSDRNRGAGLWRVSL